MLLLVKVGAYAGEVREFPFHVAQEMLADGRAGRISETSAEDVARPTDSDSIVRLIEPAGRPKPKGNARRFR